MSKLKSVTEMSKEGVKLLVIAVGITTVTTAVTLVGVLESRLFGSNDKKNVSKKKIAVLGSRGVGKTTFLTFLETGKVSHNHEVTLTKEHKMISIKGKDGKKIMLAETYDVSGKDYTSWNELVEESDIILYMMDINKVLKKEESYKLQIEQDLSKIAESIREQEQKRGDKLKVILMLNHADEYDLYKSSFQEFEKKALNNSLVKGTTLSFGGTNYCQVVIGSLANTEEAEKTVKQFINKII